MIGKENRTRGRPPEVDDEEILNVIRRSENKEVPTPDIETVDNITIGTEALRQRLNKLESNGRVESRTVGSMRLWRIGELEAEKPLKNPAMAKAHRWSNLLIGTGRTYFYIASGCLFTSITFFILFLHGNTGQINPPLLTEQQLLLTGYAFGYGGALFGVLFGVAYGAGTFVPKVTAWWLYRTSEKGRRE